MPRFAANLSMMYTEHGFLDRFAAAAADGFDAVEYLFPYAFDRQEIASRLNDLGRHPATSSQASAGWPACRTGSTNSAAASSSKPCLTRSRWLARECT